MAVVDVGGKTITLKVVYYGCALGGKTTNLEMMHQLTDPSNLTGLVSIATQDDRTLFFDLLPMDLGQIGGLKVNVKVYTVPGQVQYELTRRQVLSGADGIVLIVDSDAEQKRANAWSLENMRYNLRANGLNPDTMPIVIQWNKRDLPNALPVGSLAASLNPTGLPVHEAIATEGKGVIETFGTVLKLALEQTYAKSGRTVPADEIAETVDLALSPARAHVDRTIEGPPKQSFTHRFDIGPYSAKEVQAGRNGEAMDPEALLAEAINTNMMLAEKLDDYRQSEELSERRHGMMRAIAALAPMLADTSTDQLPQGALAKLLAASERDRASLLLFRPQAQIMDEHEVIPAGEDPLNKTVAEGLGSLAYRLADGCEVRVLEDLVSEVFFDVVPPGSEGLGSVLIAPLSCDGGSFGAILIYARVPDRGFDSAEIEYWTTASTLVGLSLHWKSLRTKIAQEKVS